MADNDKIQLILRLSLLVGIVCIGVTGGYAVGKLFNSPGSPEDPSQPEQVVDKTADDKTSDESSEKDDEEEMVYLDFEPITVNLNEPRLGRYVRATLVLAMTVENSTVVMGVIEKRMPELKNWLTLYLSGCTLEKVRGPSNLNRIRREILDSFNQQLWPDQKPMISQVLFKEFAIQ